MIDGKCRIVFIFVHFPLLETFQRPTHDSPDNHFEKKERKEASNKKMIISLWMEEMECNFGSVLKPKIRNKFSAVSTAYK